MRYILHWAIGTMFKDIEIIFSALVLVISHQSKIYKRDEQKLR